MIKRDISKSLKSLTKFPAVALLGPRESGKTTLAQETFKKHTYVSFEHLSTLQFAENDPEGFLKFYENKYGLIIDEFAYVSHLTSYIQLEIDAKKRPGYFILPSSHNYLLNKAVTQSLAGRIGILELLPLSLHELKKNKLLAENVDDVIFKGGFPRLHEAHIASNEFYPAYMQTYIERDVSSLDKIKDLATFQRFVQSCATKIGQLLVIDGIADECSISFQTARSWLSILQASYMLFFTTTPL